jgi:hypothetical protein
LGPKISKDLNHGRISTNRFMQLPSLTEWPVVNANTNNFPNCPLFGPVWSKPLPVAILPILPISFQLYMALQMP